MKFSQWSALGVASYLLVAFFIWLYKIESAVCRSSDLLAPLNRLDLTSCVISEVAGLIIPIFIIFGSTFFFCGALESGRKKN
jgi:hypothetical protein